MRGSAAGWKPPGPAGLDAIAAELAEHFERGNEPARAIPHHQRAAAKALRRSANEEAIDHLRRALDAIGHIADEGERTKVEVELQRGDGRRLHGDARLRRARGAGGLRQGRGALRPPGRARRPLSRDLGPVDVPHRPQRDATLRGGWARGCSALAEKFGDAGLKLQAHHAMWSTSFACGELAEACAHAGCGPCALRRQDSSGHGVELRQSRRRAAARAISAPWRWRSRARTSARAAMIDQSLAAARSLDDPFSLALTLYFTSAAAQMLGDRRRWPPRIPEQACDRDRARSCAAEGLEHGRRRMVHGRKRRPARRHRAADGSDRRDASDAIAAFHGLSDRVAGGCCTARPDVMPKQWRQWRTGSPWPKPPASASTPPSCIACMASLCAHPSIGQKRKAQASFRAAIKLARQQGARALERKARASLQC